MIKRVLLSLDRRQRLAGMALVISLMLGAVMETVVFLLIVPLAQTVASGEQVLRQDVGPLQIEATATSLVVTIATLVAAMTAVRLVSNYVQGRLSMVMERRERIRLLEEYVGASWETQALESPGRLQTIAGFSAAKADLLSVLANAARYALNILVMISAAFVVSPVGALGISVLGGVLFLVFRPLVAASRRLSGEQVERSTEHNEDIAELASIGIDMRVFRAGRGFLQRLIESNTHALEAKRRAALVSGAVVPMYQAIALTLAVVILGFAANRDVDVAVLGTVVILLLRSMSYGQSMQTSVQKVAEYGPALEILDSWHETYRSSHIPHGDRALGRIERISLLNASYTYGDGTLALRDLSLSIGSGEQMGLIGPSGSGKSTVVQLLLGLRSPQEGRVLLNGSDIAEYDVEMLAAAATLVPQKTSLFRGTVEENIAFFRPLDRDAVEEAARKAGLHETIMRLPEGYATQIGAARRDLSGGQAQRIGIARALAGKPSLIVLDEPTSALDVDSEELITDTIRSLPDDVIVVIVAHRISTLRHCSRLAVLDKGQMVASGTPAEVFASSDFYRRSVASGTIRDDVPLDDVTG